MPEANKRYGKSLPETIDPPERVCFIIEIPDTLQYRAALMGQLEWLADWRCWEHTQEDFYNPPADNVLAAQLFAIAVTEACQFMNCPMTCEEMIECLQPLFDAQTAQISSLQGQITSLQEQVEQIQQTQIDNAAQEIELPQTAVSNEICGGATAIVKAMNGVNEQTYEDTENSLIDNIFEFIPQFIEAVPIFGSLPFDELFELANAYFENQYTDYKDDFELIEDQLICDLSCFIVANGEFTWEVWDEWLVFVGEGFADVGSPYFENRAASVYSRYAPAANTFANQIAEILNRESSLQQYFDSLAVVWQQGLLAPEDCSACECPVDTVTVTNVGIITECGTGAIETLEVEAGVPFTMNGYLIGGSSYVLALRLPVGNWQITMNSFTGTVTPPADLNQDAYAYHDTFGTLVHVAWNAPAEPDEFGTQDTNQAAFAAWCNTEVFNAVIFNEAPFSVSFTIEPL